MNGHVGSGVPLATIIRARVSSDPGHNLSGVARQVRMGLAIVAADPNRVLATEIPGSPVFRRRHRRRRGQDLGLPRELAEFADLFVDGPRELHWPAGVLVDNDAGATTGSDGRRPNLPEYDRGVDLLTVGTVQAIWAYSLDRIWRSPSEFYDLTEHKIVGRH